MRNRAWLSVAVVTIALTVTGCSMDDDDKGMGDAPVATASTGKKGGDDSAATVTNMPDGYGNLATKCVAGAKPWRVIEGTNTACGGDWVPGAKVVMSTGIGGVTPPDDDT